MPFHNLFYDHLFLRVTGSLEARPGLIYQLPLSLCTGQIYLPVLALISQSQARYFYLLLYNLMFILPLVIVLTAVCLGMGFRRFIELSERYTAFTKLLLAGVFFALAGLLLVVG